MHTTEEVGRAGRGGERGGLRALIVRRVVLPEASAKDGWEACVCVNAENGRSPPRLLDRRRWGSERHPRQESRGCNEGVL